MKMTIILNNFVRSYRTSAKAGSILPQELINVLIGQMLGDLHAERKTSRNNTRLQINQTTKHTAYIQHLYNLLEQYVGSVPKMYTYSGGLPHMVGKKYTILKFCTLSLPCFNMFRELFYNDDGVKILPPNLGDLLTASGVAYWFMDDGYKAGNNFVFCTESFTLAENEQLVAIMKINFGLDCLVRRYTNGYRLYVQTYARYKFIQLVKPHMIPMFFYKLGL